MGIILGLCGLGVYEVTAHAHRITINRELESVAGTLRDSLQSVLQQPGRLEVTVSFLPNICLPDETCFHQTQPHQLGAVAQGNYYLRFWTKTGDLVAVTGLQPEGLPFIFDPQSSQTLTSAEGVRYRQISVVLQTQANQEWGYLQVGRSLESFDDYVATVRWILLLGIPLIIVVIAGVSWSLAGLAMQPIYKSYRQMEQFTADAAHELRTPIAAIRATLEATLMDSKVNQIEARETLGTVSRQNQRLSQLVNDLLLLSRIDRSFSGTKTEGELREPVNLNDLVEDLVEEFAALALASGVKLRAELPSASIVVRGNSQQLYRLASNLVINGIRYTPSGGEVSLFLRSNDTEVILQVEDTGIGIAKKEQQRIFERFYRVNASRNRASGGVGLGLAIAQAIAHAHQGSIRVDSTMGQGSIFTVRLPFH